MNDRFDAAAIEEGVRMILRGIGEDPERGGLRETPARVARMYGENSVATALDQEIALYQLRMPYREAAK